MYSEVNENEIPATVLPVAIWAHDMWTPDPDRVEVSALWNGRHYLVAKQDVFKVAGQWRYFVQTMDVLTEGGFDFGSPDDEEV